MTQTLPNDSLIDLQNYHEMSQVQDSNLHQQVETTRDAYFEKVLGKLPEDIRKILHFTGVWPGGGLYEIAPSGINPYWTYITAGLSNPDMPTSVKVGNVQTVKDEQGRITHQKFSLEARTPAVMPTDWAGYGYELMIITPTRAEWPLWVLQWAVGAELLHDINLRERVENNGGFTVDGIEAGLDFQLNLLINKAQPPLPNGTQLPNGHMSLLVATVIMGKELAWTFEQGRPALLQRLMTNGNGQLSNFARKSVVE